MPWKKTQAFGHSRSLCLFAKSNADGVSCNDDVDFHPLVLVDEQGQEILLEFAEGEPMSVEGLGEELKSSRRVFGQCLAH